MRILVTGGAGFIGSHVADGYVAAGHHVLVVDDLSSGKREQVNPAARLVEVDINDPDLLSLFVAERPEVVNHHAANPSVSRSVRRSCRQGNAILGHSPHDSQIPRPDRGS